MKNLLLVILLASTTMFAQQKWSAVDKESYCSLSLKTDVKNALLGSPPTNNKPSADLMLSVNMVGNDFELSVGDELFNQIKFNRCFVNFGIHSQRYIPLGYKEFDFTAVPYVGFSSITRYGGKDKEVDGRIVYGRSSHLALQGGLSLRTKLSDKILLDLTSEIMTRPDLGYMYGDNAKTFVISNYLGIHYIIE